MASFRDKVTASEILKSARTGNGALDPSTSKISRQDRRLEKEKDEMRKMGTEPAIKDIETGRDINPHIPQFISSAPWYAVQKHGPTLKHQRPHPEREMLKEEVAKLDEWYKRGVTDKVATKYRKGACENCGAMTHKKKDCFERPRKLGARFTGEDIAPDEYEQPNLKLDYDSKRDRWNGYDPAEHKHVIEEFARLEEARKMLKAQEEAEKSSDEDEDKYAETADMPGVKTDMDSATRITVRNLRIREDTAKYLYNLDPNSAYYDPKSRSMRENPFEGTNKVLEATKFAGENFVKYTGEVTDVNKAQLFAWEAKKRGIDVHALAEPTKLELLRREYEQKKKEVKLAVNEKVLEKYGGEEYLKNADRELLGAQSEAYVEYNRRGEVIKGAEKPKIMSMYEEDIYRNNHTSVWGSYWNEGQWGYACCHATQYNSYCLGKAGIEAEKAAMRKVLTKEIKEELKQEIKKEEEEASASAQAKKRRKDSSSESSDSDSSSSSSSSDEESRKKKKKKARRSSEKSKKELSEQEKLKAAIEKQKKQKEEAEKQLQLDERKRKYNVNYDDIRGPTQYDMEAYALTDKFASSDPMAAYMNKRKDK